MAIVGIRDLNRRTKDIIETLEETREPVILTRQGQPIATIQPVDRRRLNDLVISTAPEFVDSMRSAEQQFEAGKTRPLGEATAEIRARRLAAEQAEDGTVEKQGTAQEPEIGVAASAVLSAIRASVGALTSTYAAAAVSKRAKELSEAIVEEATAKEVLSREGEGSEPLEEINEINARLYGIGLAAEKFRAIDVATREITESEEEAIDAEVGSAADKPEPIDLDSLASAYVWSVNRSLLVHGKKMGGVSIGEYARSLRRASEKLEAAGEPAASQMTSMAKT